MAYTPTTWVEKVTAVGPTNLNHLELGLQAAAAVADSAQAAANAAAATANAAIPAPGAPVANGALVWNGSAWVSQLVANANVAAAAGIAYSKLALAGSIQNSDIATAAGIAPSKIGGGYAPNKITVGTIASGPPANPSDGDIWIATAVGANDQRWAFQYNAGSASASKWDFIGGPEMLVYYGGGTNFTANGAAQEDTTLGGITTPRAGDYILRAAFYGNASSSGAQSLSVGYMQNHGSASGTLASVSTSASYNVAMSFEAPLNGIASGVVLTLYYVSNGTGTAIASVRSLSLIPVRVS